MDSQGGYFAPSAWASNSAEASHDTRSASSVAADDPVTPRKLTGKQEERLRSYLDDQFIAISRGVAKRHEVSSSLPTLEAYLAAVNNLLDVILNIPLYAATGALQVAYLLRITAAVLEDVPAYSPAVLADQEHKSQEEILDALKSVLLALEVLDRAWYSVLFGRQVSVSPLRLHAQQSVERALLRRRLRGRGDANTGGPVEADHQMAMRAVGAHTSRSASPARHVDDAASEEGSDVEAITSSRYLAMPTVGKDHKVPPLDASVAKDSRPVLGGVGQRTVPQTDRVRLRNILVQGKEPVFAWMRHALGGPPPPTQIDEVTGEPITGQGVAPSYQNNEKFRQTLRPSQHVRDLFVDQGNLGDDLRPREEALSGSEAASPAAGADADPTNAGAKPRAQDDGEGPGCDVELADYRSALQCEQTDETAYLRKNSQLLLAPQEDGLEGGGPSGEVHDLAVEGGGDWQEREHYAALFDRKLDPDADDDSEDEERRRCASPQATSGPAPPTGGGVAALEAINQRSAAQLGDKRPADHGVGNDEDDAEDEDEEWEAVAGPTKRARREPDAFTTDKKALEENEELLGKDADPEPDAPGAEGEGSAPATEPDADDVLPPTPSRVAESGSAAGWEWKPLLEWDLAYAKTFHRTLRTLNDLDELRPGRE